MKNIKIIFTMLLPVFLSACNGFFDKDNTPPPSPLVKFPTELTVRNVWSTHATNGVNGDYVKLVPAVTDHTIITASTDGTITATDKMTGKNIWKANARMEITGGPATNNSLAFVGSRDGEVAAFDLMNGRQLWRAKVANEILAPPAANENFVLVKTIDGHITAFAPQDGHVLWTYEQTEPTLILRGSSAPQISHGDAIIGFANGDLTKLTLHDGNLQWHQAVALPNGSFAIQRMVDIDADPIIFNERIYAATYQGQIASLDFSTGKVMWSHDISSYSGIAADAERVYVSDGKSHVWAFDTDSGTVDWKQNQLEARNITGPALIGNYVVVGDEEGYLHWLSKIDGHFVARVRVNSSGILAMPVTNNNTIYVVAKNGRLASYTAG